jgi:hypothetical protein
MKNIAQIFAAATLLLAAADPSFAAEAVYPRGIRVGLAPIKGLAQAQAFVGFESEDRGVKVLLAELPAPAYGEVEIVVAAKAESSAGVKPEALQTTAGKGFFTVENAKDGADNVRRYSLIVPGGGTFSGYVAVQVSEAAGKTYSDDAIRQMFATVTVRQQVPVEEQLALMPFKMSEQASFKTVRMLAPGAAMLLADGADDNVEAAPFMVLGLIGSAPDKPDDRGRFAQQAATLIPGLRDARITMSEPVRIDGAAGYETRLDAISGKDNTPVSVVQWLRFGGANVALRIIASTPRDQWSTAFPRFRAVRDGVQSR